MTFKIKESRTKDTYFSLIEENGEIILIGENDIDGIWNIVTITKDGYLYKCSSIPNSLGLKLNDSGKIIDAECEYEK